MGKIEFTMANLKKCICPSPVQADSACAKKKLMKMMQEMEDKLMSNPGMFLQCTALQEKPDAKI